MSVHFPQSPCPCPLRTQLWSSYLPKFPLGTRATYYKHGGGSCRYYLAPDAASPASVTASATAGRGGQAASTRGAAAGTAHAAAGATRTGGVAGLTRAASFEAEVEAALAREAAACDSGSDAGSTASDDSASSASDCEVNLASRDAEESGCRRARRAGRGSCASAGNPVDGAAVPFVEPLQVPRPVGSTFGQLWRLLSDWITARTVLWQHGHDPGPAPEWTAGELQARRPRCRCLARCWSR